MHVVGERLDVLDGGGREDAVAEIEDVTRPSADAVEHLVGAVNMRSRAPGAAADRGCPGSRGRGRCAPRRRRWRSPVDADHGAARFALSSKERRARAEVDDGHARSDVAQDVRACGSDELAVVVGEARRPRSRRAARLGRPPRSARAGTRRRSASLPTRACQVSGSGTSAPWSREVRALAAFDQVAREREGRARKADQRRLAVELRRIIRIASSTCAERPSRGSKHAQALDVSSVAHGSRSTRPFARARTRRARPSARAARGCRRRGWPRRRRCGAPAAA